jgi:hypothetical protein
MLAANMDIKRPIESGTRFVRMKAALRRDEVVDERQIRSPDVQPAGLRGNASPESHPMQLRDDNLIAPGNAQQGRWLNLDTPGP